DNSNTISENNNIKLNNFNNFIEKYDNLNIDIDIKKMELEKKRLIDDIHNIDIELSILTTKKLKQKM
ncbi:MAG: hypothetical protein KIT69_02780, partial [Propionibacteriaceae bacterium]|nr:hypothetical protein [Propionibacteriaceae bacterium]